MFRIAVILDVGWPYLKTSKHAVSCDNLCVGTWTLNCQFIDMPTIIAATMCSA